MKFEVHAITVNLHASSSNNIQIQMYITLYFGTVDMTVRSLKFSNLEGKTNMLEYLLENTFPSSINPCRLTDVTGHTIHLRHETFVLIRLLEQHNNYCIFMYKSATTFLFIASLYLFVYIV